MEDAGNFQKLGNLFLRKKLKEFQNLQNIERIFDCSGNSRLTDISRQLHIKLQIENLDCTFRENSI
jgi:hypothetical protein